LGTVPTLCPRCAQINFWVDEIVGG